MYHRCGGCVYRHLTEESELQIKKQTVENAMKRIGHLDVPVADTVSFGFSRYRNKVVYPLVRNKEGDTTFGYYARHTHAIVEHEACPLQEDLFSQIAMFHVKQSEKHHVPVWNEQTGKGVLRHIAMRKNRKGEYYVCFTASKAFSKAKSMAEELMETFPQVIGVALNVNPKGDNVIFGEETLHLAGATVLRDTLRG